MPNINAAIGCAQLENLNTILKNKRRLYEIYKHNFSKIDGVSFFCEPKYSNSNNWLNTILVDKEKFSKNKILKYSNKILLRTRPSWKMLSTLKPYNDCPRSSLQETIELENSIINLPSSSFLID